MIRLGRIEKYSLKLERLPTMIILELVLIWENLII
nr:MAG TPA: hypothetical protein [Bacteriophage sp.]